MSRPGRSDRRADQRQPVDIAYLGMQIVIESLRWRRFRRDAAQPEEPLLKKCCATSCPTRPDTSPFGF